TRGSALCSTMVRLKCNCPPVIAWLLAVVVILSAATSSVADVCHSDRLLKNADFEVRCTNSPNLQVHILCKTSNNNTWSNFPRERLNLIKVESTIFRKCSFDSDLNLLDITSKFLNLRSIDRLVFEHSLGPPGRENLRGFNLQRLQIVDNDFVELPADMLHDVKVDELRVERIPLRSIPRGFFGNSSEISSIDIVGTKLNHIESDAFSSLSKLRKLALYNNNIETIAPDAFDELVNLRFLDLGLNKLHSLPGDVLKKLAKLEIINLSQNEFDELPGDLLQIGKSRLQKFRLSHNRGKLKTLPSGFFRGLSGLNETELTSNGFTSLPADLFNDSINLTSLNMNNNSLTSLPPNIFDNTNLRVLGLSRNKLETLPQDIFSHGNLQTLDMNHNRLRNLSKDTLAELVKLETLQVSHNDLTYIDGDACKILKELRNVDLSYNQLTLDHPNNSMSILLDCKNIVDANLSHNKITRIFGDWLYKSQLKNLNLEYNDIRYVSVPDLRILRPDAVLNLKNNKITTVNLTGLVETVEQYNKHNKNIFRNAKVYLDNNPLHCDCHLLQLFEYYNRTMNNEIYSYIKLEPRDLKCQSPVQFTNISITTIGLDNLNCPVKTNVTTDACNNTCTCWDYPGKKVLAVDCSYRNLTSVPKDVGNPNNRSIELDLSGNKLLKTPAMNTSYLLNVTVLNLSSNNISTVTLSVFSRNLQKLMLHNNSISRLDNSVVEYLSDYSTLSKLTLYQNRWICDCEARNFLIVVQKKLSQKQSQTLHTIDLQEDTCSGTNRLFSSMTVNELCEGAIAIIVVSCLLIALFGVILGLLAALYYRYQKEIKVWLYSKQWCLWFVTEDELDKDKMYDAFISFSHKDEDFVEKEIVAKLEDGPKPYKLCLHYRDWLAGEWIPAQIARSVDESRRTIVVLSPNFIESIWGRMEFRTAHSQALSEGRARVIVILYGDIGNTEDLDPELKAYLSMNTYVKWGDPWFWDKLKYALPHRYEPSKRRTRTARIIENHLAQLPVNNHNDHVGNKSEVIPMPKISTSSNDSAKLLDSAAEDDRIVQNC
ncbi:hypothetical protein TSAR_001895, partial [Trichomalopsis sarcophagae]